MHNAGIRAATRNPGLTSSAIKYTHIDKPCNEQTDGDKCCERLQFVWERLRHYKKPNTPASGREFATKCKESTSRALTSVSSAASSEQGDRDDAASNQKHPEMASTCPEAEHPQAIRGGGLRRRVKETYLTNTQVRKSSRRAASNTIEADAVKAQMLKNSFRRVRALVLSILKLSSIARRVNRCGRLPVPH